MRGAARLGHWSGPAHRANRGGRATGSRWQGRVATCFAGLPCRTAPLKAVHDRLMQHARSASLAAIAAPLQLARLLTARPVLGPTCGGEMKSRTGTGIFFTRYSHTASTLYLSCAEMGTTGAPSAMVPCGWGGGGHASRWE